MGHIKANGNVRTSDYFSQESYKVIYYKTGKFQRDDTWNINRR